MTRRKGALWLTAVLCGLTACSNAEDDTVADEGDESAQSDADNDRQNDAEADDEAPDYETQATLDVKEYVGAELAKLTSAAAAIQAAAPEPDEDGWNAADDEEALEEMRSAWKDARMAYEHIEGSIAVLFSGLDEDTDARYDAFIEVKDDDDLFDDEGVIGMHAIERILWSDSTPEHVVKFEKALPGYKEAAFPQTEEEAEAFKNALCERLVRDTKQMQEEFDSVALDATSAFRGMILSVQEQSEKTNKAASGEDESRYSQITLADMRANLEGARAVYQAFKPWIEDSEGDIEGIEAGLQKLEDAYADVEGDALPKVPDGFNPDEPSEEHLESPYGKLWRLLGDETADEPGSLVTIMSEAADRMDIPGIEAEE